MNEAAPAIVALAIAVLALMRIGSRPNDIEGVRIMAKWEPIETAPKDGTVVDLWVSYDDGGGKRVPDGFWQNESIEWGPTGDDREQGWAAANMGYDGCDGWADEPDDGSSVTHWMPLPSPPE